MFIFSEIKLKSVSEKMYNNNRKKAVFIFLHSKSSIECVQKLILLLTSSNNIKTNLIETVL